MAEGTDAGSRPQIFVTEARKVKAQDLKVQTYVEQHILIHHRCVHLCVCVHLGWA